MKIQYYSSIDEEIDAQMRLLGTLRTTKKWKLHGFILVPLVFIGFYFTIPDEESVKLIFASLGSMIFAMIYFGSYIIMIKRRAKKLAIEQLDSDKPVPSEYELNEEGVILRRMGTEIKFDWNNVKRINETDKYIEFIMDKGGMAIIPNRIFIHANQREEWLKFARSKSGI